MNMHLAPSNLLELFARPQITSQGRSMPSCEYRKYFLTVQRIDISFQLYVIQYHINLKHAQ